MECACARGHNRWGIADKMIADHAQGARDLEMRVLSGPDFQQNLFIEFRTLGQGVENPAPFEGADESYPLEQHFHTTNNSDIYSKNNGVTECEKHISSGYIRAGNRKLS